MVKQSQIARGKKWTEVRDKAIFENRSKDAKWLETQPAIVSDIEAYENSLKPEAKPKKEK